MFRGDRPVGTVSDPETDREEQALHREQAPRQEHSESPSRSRSRSRQDPAATTQRGRVARTDEERIEELESTVQQLRAELVRRENEQQSLVDRYEALLRDRGRAGDRDEGAPAGRAGGDPRTGQGRDGEPWTRGRLREVVRALLPW